MKIVILGAPGCGKGTQAKLLEMKYGLKHLAAGDLIREEVANKTELGRKVESYVSKGKLAPDEIVIKLIKKAILNNDKFILDGFPRNLNQAKALDKISDLDLAVNIDIDDYTAIKRLSARRICPKCDAIFHLKTSPPKRKNICDFCKSKLIQRSDDREEVIKERLKVYKEETLPLIDYYRSKGILKVIDGNKSIEEVFRELEKNLEPSLTKSPIKLY